MQEVGRAIPSIDEQGGARAWDDATADEAAIVSAGLDDLPDLEGAFPDLEHLDARAPFKINPDLDAGRHDELP